MFLLVTLLIYFIHLVKPEATGVDFSFTDVTETLLFWTPERIARAIPLGTHINSRTLAKGLGETERFGSCSPPTNKILGNYSVNYPWIGILLVYLGGKEFKCSASVVRSPGGKMISSAGHCIINPSGVVYQNPMFILQSDPNNNSSTHWPISGAWWEKCYQAKPVSGSVWDFSFLRTKDVILPYSRGLIFPNDVNSDLILTEYGYPGAKEYGGYLFGCSGQVCASNFPYFPPCRITGTDMSFSLGCEGSPQNEGMSGGPVVGGVKPNQFIAGVISYYYGSLWAIKQYFSFFGTSAHAVYALAVANGA